MTIAKIIEHLGLRMASDTFENGFRELAQRVNMEHAPRLIGFCGAAGAGKDTASFFLELLGYQKIAFADALKIEAYDMITKPTEEYRYRVFQELDISLPGFLEPASTDFEKIKIINENKVQWRKLLQWHGTEYRRAENPNYWIDQVRRKIVTGRWVVSDVRFQNEIALIRELQGQVWLISGRDDGYTPAHASELDWQGTTFDQQFVNDSITGFQSELYRRVLSPQTTAV